MPRIMAWVQLTPAQSEDELQRRALLAYAHEQGLSLDGFIEGPKLLRPFPAGASPWQSLLELSREDILVVTELRRLGHSTLEVLEHLHHLMHQQIRLIVLEPPLELTGQEPEHQVLSAWCLRLSELERDFVRRRTRAGLEASRAQGRTLGKPKGTIQASKFDADRERIEELLLAGLSGRKIAETLKYPNAIGLNKYIRRRGLRQRMPQETSRHV